MKSIIGQVKHSWSNLCTLSPVHSACQPPNHLPFPVILAVAPIVFLPVTWTTHSPHTWSLFNQLHAHTFHRTLPVHLLSCPCNRVPGCPPDFVCWELFIHFYTFYLFLLLWLPVCIALFHHLPVAGICLHYNFSNPSVVSMGCTSGNDSRFAEQLPC